MKSLKNWIIFITAAILLFSSLTSCSKNGDDNSVASDNTVPVLSSDNPSDTVDSDVTDSVITSDSTSDTVAEITTGDEPKESTITSQLTDTKPSDSASSSVSSGDGKEQTSHTTTAEKETTAPRTVEPEVTLEPNEDGIVRVTKILLEKTELKMNEYDKYTLTAQIQPSNATDKEYSFSSSDQKVATITKDGTISAVSAGSTVITVKSSDGGFSASCTVTVVSEFEIYNKPYDIDKIEAELVQYGKTFGIPYKTVYPTIGKITPKNSTCVFPMLINAKVNELYGKYLKQHLFAYVKSNLEYQFDSAPKCFTIYIEKNPFSEGILYSGGFIVSVLVVL